MRLAPFVIAFSMACSTPAPNDDAATPASDAGHDATVVDTGVAAVDTGVAPVDTGMATFDSGAPADAWAADAGSTSIAEVIDQTTFDALFLHRTEAACNAQVYDYTALVTAAAHFPTFLSEGTLDQRRREAAAFLANASHETTGGWATAPDGPSAWGLCFREELGCGTGSCTGYCDTTSYPCPSGHTYHGRGPLQLSWNYNYAQCGTAIGQDLLNHPELVTSDGVIGWEATIWFWMTAQAPKPSCHDAIVGRWTPSSADVAAGRQPGFGVTIDIINGGLECHMPGDSRVADRMAFYARYCTRLGVTQGDHVDCATMSAF